MCVQYFQIIDFMIQLLTIIAYMSSSIYILKKTRQRASTFYSLFKNIKILKIFR